MIGFSRLSKHCLNFADVLTGEGNKLACSRTGNTNFVLNCVSSLKSHLMQVEFFKENMLNKIILYNCRP